jgi:hypothetical protein
LKFIRTSVLALALLSAPAQAFQVGYTKIAASAGTYAAGVTDIDGPFVMPECGILQSMSIYHTATATNIFLGVYGDLAGLPKALLAKTASTAVPATTAWLTAPPTVPGVKILGGTTIYVGVLSITTAMAGMFEPNTIVLQYKFWFDSGSDAALPNPFSNTGTSSPFSPDAISIYATFSPCGGDLPARIK